MNEPHLTPRGVALAVLYVALLMVAVAGAFSARAAVLALGAFALAGAGARVFMPLSRAFAVRRRLVDVSVLLVFAVGLLYLGVTAPLD